MRLKVDIIYMGGQILMFLNNLRGKRTKYMRRCFSRIAGVAAKEVERVYGLELCVLHKTSAND